MLLDDKFIRGMTNNSKLTIPELLRNSVENFAENNSLIYVDLDGAESILGIEIPTYVTLNKGRKGNIIGTCKCTAEQFPLLVETYNRHYQLYNQYRSGNYPPEKGAIAKTSCTSGGPENGHASILWLEPSCWECIDACVLAHELVHADQCHRLGVVLYQGRTKQELEPPAFAVSLNCLWDWLKVFEKEYNESIRRK